MDFAKACQLLLDVSLEQKEGAAQPISLADKLAACRAIADHLSAKTTRGLPDFKERLTQGVSVLLRIYGDREMSVWSVAEECLNRLIKSLLRSEQSDRVVVELYRGLKASNIRSSRFALTKLAEVCHLANPRKRRKLMLSLTPILRLIIERQDDTLQESLSTALGPLAKHLGPYLVEREQRDILLRLLRNLGATKAAIRRAAAASALAWAQGCGAGSLPFLVDSILRMATQQSRFFTPSKMPSEPASPQRQWVPADSDCEAGALLGLAHVFRHAGSAVFEVPRPLTPVLQLAYAALRGTDHNAVCSALDLVTHLLASVPPVLPLEPLDAAQLTSEIMNTLERHTRATVRCAVLGALASLAHIDAAAVQTALTSAPSAPLGTCSAYLTDEDPALRAAALGLVYALAEAALPSLPADLPRLLSYLHDPTSAVARAALAGLRPLMSALVRAKVYTSEVIAILEALLGADRNPHFLFRIERASLLAAVPWAALFESLTERLAPLQRRCLVALCTALGDADARVVEHVAGLFPALVLTLHVPHLLDSTAIIAASTPLAAATELAPALLSPAAAVSAECVIRTLVTTTLRPSRPALVRGAVKALACLSEAISAAQDASHARFESPIGGSVREVLQVAQACLALPAMAADAELVTDFCRLVASSLTGPLDAAAWEPLALLLLRLLRMLVSAATDQAWQPDPATPPDEAAAHQLLHQRLVSSRGVTLVSMRREKYDELCTAASKAFARLVLAVGPPAASLLPESAAVLSALMDEEAPGCVACIDALCTVLIPRRTTLLVATAQRIAPPAPPGDLAELFAFGPRLPSAPSQISLSPAPSSLSVNAVPSSPQKARGAVAAAALGAAFGGPPPRPDDAPIAFIPNPKETLRIIEPLVVRVVQRYAHSHDLALHEATLSLLACLAGRGIDFNKLDADRRMLTYLLAQPAQHAAAAVAALPALAKFVAVAMEDLPHLVADAAVQDFLLAALQLPALDASALAPVIRVAFRSPTADYAGVRDATTQRLLAMLDTDRRALGALAVALQASAVHQDRHRALSAHIVDALLRLACADRPAVSSGEALDSALALCAQVALLAGGAQALVGAIASVLPPQLLRQKQVFVQSDSTDEALLFAAGIAWLPAAIILFRLVARYCTTQDELVALWPASPTTDDAPLPPSSSPPTATPAARVASEAIASLILSTLTRVATLRAPHTPLVRGLFRALLHSVSALLGLSSLPAKRGEGPVVRALQRQRAALDTVAECVCASDDLALLSAYLPLAVLLYAPSPALCSLAAASPRRLGADLSLVALAQLAVLNAGALSLLPPVSPPLLHAVVALAARQAQVKAFGSLLIKGRVVEVEEALAALDVAALEPLSALSFVALMPPSGVCLPLLASLHQRMLGSGVLTKLDEAIGRHVDGLLALSHRGEVDRQQLYRILEPLQALPFMKTLPRFLDLLKAVLYRRSRPSEAPAMVLSVPEVVVRNALTPDFQLDFRLLAVLPSGMPEHLGAKRRALCGPLNDLKTVAAQELLALLAYAKGALQARVTFPELAVPLAALLSLGTKIAIDGLGMPAAELLEQATALISACAHTDAELSAALRFTSAVAASLSDSILSHPLGRTLTSVLLGLYTQYHPSALLQLPPEARDPVATVRVLADGLNHGHMWRMRGGMALAELLRVLSRAHSSALCDVEELSALSDVAWEAMPWRTDVLGPGAGEQLQRVWRAVETGLRAPPDEVDPATRERMIYSATSLLLQAFGGGSASALGVPFTPRDADAFGVPDDASQLFLSVKERAAHSLYLLSRLIASRTRTLSPPFAMHGNIERDERSFYFGQASVSQLRAFARLRHQEIDAEELLLEALTLLEQLALPPHAPAVRLAALEAIIVLSDLYSHPRFIWLYGLLQKLHVQSEPTDDATLQPLTLLGMSKAVAVLQWDSEQSRYEFVADALNVALTRTDLSQHVLLCVYCGILYLLDGQCHSVVRPLIPLLTRSVSRTLEDPSAGHGLKVHSLSVAFALLKAELLGVTEDQHFTRHVVEAALIHGGAPLMLVAELQERLSALPVGPAILRFGESALHNSREPLTHYFGLLSLSVLSFGRQREAVVFAEMEKTKVLVARLHDSPLLDGRVGSPLLLRLLQQLPPADALSACMSDTLKLSQRGNAALLYHVLVPLLLSVRQRVRLQPWIVDASASFLEVRPTSNIRAALTAFFLVAVLAQFPYLGLLTAETIHFAEELFVIAGRDFFLSMKNKDEEGLFLAVLKKHISVPECATLIQVLLPLRH